MILKEKTKSVNEDIKDFLESLENANLFVLQLLKDTDEYKKFIASNVDKDTPSLFD